MLRFSGGLRSGPSVATGYGPPVSSGRPCRGQQRGLFQHDGLFEQADERAYFDFSVVWHNTPVEPRNTAIWLPC